MHRDDQIRFLWDKLAEYQREFTAVITAQCSPATSRVFDDYVADIRRIEAAYNQFATRLEELTDVEQNKRVESNRLRSKAA